MISLSRDLVSRCREILLECDKFDFAETLKTVFSIGELAPFQYALPQANSREERVDQLMGFLMHKKRQRGYPILLSFLNNLRIYISSEDNLYRELEQLCIDIEYAYFSKGIFATHNNNEYAPSSLGEFEDFSDNVAEIAQYLLKLNHMRDKHLVEDVLKLLPMEIAQNISMNGHMFGFKDILHIVQTCHHYSDGLEKLAYALYQKECESPHWQALDASLRRISKKTITYTRLQQLQSILEGITWSDKILIRAYKVSIPDGWVELSTDSSTYLLPSILENLAVAPLQSDGTFPIIVFAQYLAHYTQKYRETSIQTPLIGWIREKSRNWG